MLDLTQLSLHIKPCGCRRAFPYDGVLSTSWNRLPGSPRKTWISQIPDDLECRHPSAYWDACFNVVVAMEEGRYDLWRLRVDYDDGDGVCWLLLWGCLLFVHEK